MPSYEFNLRIQGELTDDRLENLFEAGCDDMTFTGGEGFGTATAGTTREAPMFLEAALSAIRDIEKVDGLRVIAVDTDFGDDTAARAGRALNAALTLRQAEGQVTQKERQELLAFVQRGAA